MIDRLFVARGDNTFGPFSAAQLRRLAATGQIQLTDSIWRHGAMEQAVFAAKVKNLFPAPPVLAAGKAPGAAETPGPTPAPTAAAVPSSAPVVPSAPPPDPSAALGRSDEAKPVTAAPTNSAPQDSAAVVSPAEPSATAKAVPREKAPPPTPELVRKRRAIAVKGAVILSQDGVTVHYRKKCSQCGFEDRCRSVMPIGNGMTRGNFFCTKCRKGREVQIQGIMQ
ncbi:MAG TPA: GYF domain-containing protein [Gemmataceae bacterium]|nr:GYF domain-containing protein [Gemmataceae bacterium]